MNTNLAGASDRDAPRDGPIETVRTLTRSGCIRNRCLRKSRDPTALVEHRFDTWAEGNETPDN